MSNLLPQNFRTFFEIYRSATGLTVPPRLLICWLLGIATRASALVFPILTIEILKSTFVSVNLHPWYIASSLSWLNFAIHCISPFQAMRGTRSILFKTVAPSASLECADSISPLALFNLSTGFLFSSKCYYLLTGSFTNPLIMYLLEQLYMYITERTRITKVVIKSSSHVDWVINWTQLAVDLHLRLWLIFEKPH